jgi:hypothetical protein
MSIALAKSVPLGPLRRRRRKMRVIRGGKVERSDPTPERISQAETHFEVSDTLILRFQDDGLGRAFRAGLLDDDKEKNRALYGVGQRYHEVWYSAGLAGFVPAMGVEPSVVVSGNDFGGLPRSQFEEGERRRYRDVVQDIGMVRARILDLVICRGFRVEVVDLGWPGALGMLRDGLRGAAKRLGGA